MGKPTGFMEYDREVSKAVEPKERIKNFDEFHIHLSKKKTGDSGITLHGMRRSLLSVRYDTHGHDQRLPTAQSGAGVE